MNFFQAVFSGFRNYANFSSRASRSELWYWALFLLVLQEAAELLELFIAYRFPVPVQCPVQLVSYTAILVPTFALASRRFHDIGRSGWWAVLMPVIPPFSYIFLSAVLLLMAYANTIALYDASLHWKGPVWLFPVLICVGTIFLWPFFFRRGEASANRFGADPYWGREERSKKRVFAGAFLSLVLSAVFAKFALPMVLQPFMTSEHMRNIARHYAMQENDAAAAQWYSIAADNGDAKAQVFMGRQATDMQERFMWFLKAAEQGNGYAQAEIGNSYNNGIAVVKDEKQAEHWYRKAIAQGVEYAYFNLASMYLARGDKAALAWYLNAVKWGKPGAKTALGKIYAEGKIVPRDDQAALKWYLEGLQEMNVPQFSIMYEQVARIYYESVPQNRVEAYKWLEKAQPGKAIPMPIMPVPDPKNPKVLIWSLLPEQLWLVQGAERGDVVLQKYVGNLYAAMNAQKAIEWYQKAASQGDAEAQKKLEELQKKKP